MGYPQKNRLQQSSLFNLKKLAKLLIVSQESERLRCMSTIHLSLLGSWVTMRSLARFFKLNRELCCTLFFWGYPIFVQCLYGMVGYLLELLEVTIAFQLIHLSWKFPLDSTFLGIKPQRHALKCIYLIEGDGHSMVFIFLLFLSRRNLQ